MRLVEDVRRRLYRGGRPGSVARFLNHAQAWLAAHGLGPTRVAALETRGRRSGRTVSTPVVVTEYDGSRYLVAMFGEHSSWVRNVRAAHGDAVIRHRTEQAVRLEEVPVDRRGPILKRYLSVAPGARPHLPIDPRADLADFDGIAADFPVFRLVDRDDGPRATPSPGA